MKSSARDGASQNAVQTVQVNTPSQLSSLLPDCLSQKLAVTLGAERIPPKTTVHSLVDLDISGLNNVIEYGVTDQFIHVQTGITIGALQIALGKNNQWWPVVAPHDWTLLDVIQRGYGGSLETRFGGPRDLVTGGEVVLVSGATIKCGGRVVKNVTGYDMTKLFIGSRSTLGVLSSAFLRLYARPDSSETLVFSFANLEDLFDRCRVLCGSGLPISALEVIDATTANECRLETGEHSILVQIHGIAGVRADVADGVGKLLGPPLKSISAAEEDTLWLHLATVFGAEHHDFKVETMLPMTEMAGLFSAAARKKVRFCGRPWTGRVALLAEQALDAVSIVKTVAERRNLNWPVAYANERYNYLCDWTLRSDAARDKVQQELKKRFDPANALNPLVKL